MPTNLHRTKVNPARERCERCRASAASSHSRTPSTTRFWLPRPGRFAQIAVDLDTECGSLTLLCLRRVGHGRLQTANAFPNRYRLRELETALLDLEVELPPVLRRYFVAALVGDDAEQRNLQPRVRSLLCCKDGASGAEVSRAEASSVPAGALARRVA